MAKLFVCGDISNYTPGLGFISDNLAQVIKGVDYAVCNFEGPEMPAGETPIFPHQEAGTASYLRENGFDLMLLANNHITEHGAEGLRNSINVIESVNADFIGAGFSWNDAYKYLIRDINGLRFGFINICEAQPGYYKSPNQSFGYAWMGYEDLLKDISIIRSKTDRVVVFVHAGLEHYPIPLPEIRDLYRKLCDAGASAIIGGHTHSAQGYEYYKNKLIVYSLGNFYFPICGGLLPEENYSYSLILDFDLDGGIKIEPIYHTLENDQVILETNVSKQCDINYLCELLGNGYTSIAKKMCEESYNKLISRLLCEATFGIYDGMSRKHVLKRVLTLLLFYKKSLSKSRKQREKLLLHLFENETYRWTICRALKDL